MISEKEPIDDIHIYTHFPGGSDGICLQCRGPGFHPLGGTIPWRRAWQPTLGFLPGDSPMGRGAWWAMSMGSQRVEHNWATKHNGLGYQEPGFLCLSSCSCLVIFAGSSTSPWHFKPETLVLLLNQIIKQINSITSTSYRHYTDFIVFHYFISCTFHK